VARTLLLGATIVWLVAGVIGIGIGLTSAAGLQRLLPPLAIDLAALGGAVVAVGIGVLAIGIVHAGVVVALRAGSPFAPSAALLLAITMTTLMLVLAAAAVTSAVTVPERAPPLLVATAAALAAASAYGLVASQLAIEVRARRAR
jgi:hypothetical protein